MFKSIEATVSLEKIGTALAIALLRRQTRGVGSTWYHCF